MTADAVQEAEETIDLRKRPYMATRGDLLAYGAATIGLKITTALPTGTQARFITLAQLAAAHGQPLNTLMTIAWDRLFASNEVNQLRCEPVPGHIDIIIERLRHWLTNREVAALYIWVREQTRSDGEHFHVGFHLPTRLRMPLARQVAIWTDEEQAGGKHRAATRGEFACGECRSWHLAADADPRHGGLFLAAYLGKAEPSRIKRWGKWRNNDRKPVRGKDYGGDQPTAKYDSEQGFIMGTEHRRDRFFVSKALQTLAKRHG